MRDSFVQLSPMNDQHLSIEDECGCVGPEPLLFPKNDDLTNDSWWLFLTAVIKIGNLRLPVQFWSVLVHGSHRRA